MNKKTWNTPEICQLGIENTEHNTLHSNRVDKDWIDGDNVRNTQYS